MEKEKIIDLILNHLYFEEIHTLLDRIFLHKGAGKEMSGNNFKHFVKKYDINLYYMASKLSENKEFSNKEQGEIYKELRMIGHKNKVKYSSKKSNEVKEKIYIRNAHSKETQILKEMCLKKEYDNESSHKNVNNKSLNLKLKLRKSFSLSSYNIMFKTSDIIDYFNSNLQTNFSILDWTKEDVEKVLQNCNIDFLEELLSYLQNGCNDGYLEDRFETDPYSSFLDETDIQTLYFIKENFETLLKYINEINDFKYKILDCFEEDNYNSIINALSKKKVLKEGISLPIFSNSTNVFLNDEHHLRYKEIHRLLSTNEYCDKFTFVFRNMTPKTWEIIRLTFKTYGNPCGEAVKNFFYKSIENI